MSEFCAELRRLYQVLPPTRSDSFLAGIAHALISLYHAFLPLNIPNPKLGMILSHTSNIYCESIHSLDPCSLVLTGSGQWVYIWTPGQEYEGGMDFSTGSTGSSYGDNYGYRMATGIYPVHTPINNISYRMSQLRNAKCVRSVGATKASVSSTYTQLQFINTFCTSSLSRLKTKTSACFERMFESASFLFHYVLIG